MKWLVEGAFPVSLLREHVVARALRSYAAAGRFISEKEVVNTVTTATFPGACPRCSVEYSLIYHMGGGECPLVDPPTVEERLLTLELEVSILREKLR